MLEFEQDEKVLNVSGGKILHEVGMALMDQPERKNILEDIEYR